MKKVLVICLTLLMLLSMSLTAFADKGGFVASPSNNLAPEVVEITSEKGFRVELIVTPYAQRNTLPAADQAEVNKAYSDIASTDDVTVLQEGLVKKAEAVGANPQDLAVSDLFHLTVRVIGEGTAEGPYSVKLRSDILENFVGLLHMRGGAWSVVEQAEVKGDILTFAVDDFSPFAVVVDTNPGSSATGDNSMPWMFAALALISGIGLIYCFVKSRKQTA